MDKNKINHTFVICAYKKSQYLEDCIQSLQRQTVKSNIIMATSTPNDYLDSISKKHNIPLYINSEKKGIGSDWNFALSLPNTEYVTIAHQDDIYLKNYSIKCIKQLENKKGVIAFTNYQEIRDDKVQDKNINLKIKDFMLFFLYLFPGSKFIRRRVLSFGSPICCPAVTYNMIQLNGFRFSTDLSVSLDWDAWIRMTEFGGLFNYIPENLMYHRIHLESETTNAIENNQRAQEDLRMFEKFWPLPIAKIIYSIYKKSEKTNFIGEKRNESTGNNSGIQ